MKSQSNLVTQLSPHNIILSFLYSKKFPTSAFSVRMFNLMCVNGHTNFTNLYLNTGWEEARRSGEGEEGGWVNVEMLR